MKKIIYILIISFILLILGGIFVKDRGFVFTYINPETDTSTFPYIAKSTKRVNDLLYRGKDLSKDYIPDLKILYVNGLGSVFFKHNITASDYDCGAGVYLGKFEYDGNNARQIAEELTRLISFYQEAVYSAANEPNSSFYLLSPKNEVFNEESFSESLDLAAKSIDYAHNGKSYMLDLDNAYHIMKSNQIVLPEYKLIRLFSRDVCYHPVCSEKLNALTINVNYYFDIMDKDNKIMRFYAATNKLFEYTFLMPQIFVNLNSADFITNFMKSGKSDSYFDSVFCIFVKHYNYKTDNPLKFVKRMFQSADLMKYVLPKEIVKNIRQDSYQVLSNPNIALINNYYNANINLYDITRLESTYNLLEENNEVEKLIQEMNQMLLKIEEISDVDSEELKFLRNYQNTLNNYEAKYKKLKFYTGKKLTNVNTVLYHLMELQIPNYSKFLEYRDCIKKVFDDAGMYQIKIYQDKPNHAYVFEDIYSKKIPLTEYSKLIFTGYNYVTKFHENTVFEFTNDEKFNGDKKKIEIYWIRYNPTEEQNVLWKNIKKEIVSKRFYYYPRLNIGVIK